MAAGLALVLLSSLPASASVEDFSFEAFDASYELDRTEDGRSSMTVTETLVALFPEYDQNRGLARYLPTTYQRVSLETEMLSVTDESGSPRPWSTMKEGDVLVIESVVPQGQYVYGRQVYRLTYQQENVIGDFTESTGVQEFYWDINGSGWPQRFGRVTAEIRVPADIAPSVRTDRMACYQGAEGSTVSCEMSATTLKDGSLKILALAGPLAPYETVTVAIAFERDTFVVPVSSVWDTGWLYAQILGALGALVMAGWMVSLRRRVFADAPGRPVIVAEYLPPKNVTIAEASTLQRVPGKIPLAGLLDLAVSGAIVLSENPEKRGRWSLIRKDAPLSAEGEKILQVLFGSTPSVGESTPLPRRSTAVGDRLTSFSSSVRSRMMQEGFYRRIGAGRRAAVIVPTLFSALFAVGGALSALDEGYGDLIVWVLGLVGGGLSGWVLSIAFRTPLGDAGAEARDFLAGLKLYIRLAEKDRLAYLQSPQGALREKVSADDPREVLKLYERLLPWAVVLGEEKRWLRELDALYRDQQPTWIDSPNPGFMNSLSSFQSATASSFQSSSSGGSSGGGSAGGGGGGGGGGGR